MGKRYDRECSLVDAVSLMTDETGFSFIFELSCVLFTLRVEPL